jgi:hypothetical protein
MFSLVVALVLCVAARAQLSDVSFSLDHCNTASPLYPNGAALTTSFMALADAAQLRASHQNFDTNAAATVAPNTILFPAGSPFNGTVNISVVNGTLTSQTCTLLVPPPPPLAQTRTQPRC